MGEPTINQEYRVASTPRANAVENNFFAI